MGVCTDITLFCDKCNGNDILAGSVSEARKIAKSREWVRRVDNDHRTIDVCNECKKVKELWR